MSNLTITLEIKAPGIVKAIQALGQIMAGGTQTQTIVQSPAMDTPVKEPEKVESKPVEPVKPEPEPESKPETKPTITMEEIKALVVTKSKEHKEEIKQFLTEYGVEKVTRIPKEQYEAFYKKVGDL